MTNDNKELKAIQKYLETLLNVGYSIEEINGKKYVPIEDLQEDLHYIRTCLIRKVQNEQ